MDLSVVDTMPHGSPDLIIYMIEIRAVWRPQVWCKKSLAFLDAAVQLLHVRGALSCWNKVVTRHSAYRWQQYDVIMTSWSSSEEVSKRYHQNFLLCNNNEITACNADLLNSFCEEVYAVAFFKVVQQQTIGKVENSIICLWADNFVCNSERITNKCVSKTDTNPPFAFQITFPRGTDFTGFLQGGSKIRDL